MKQWSKYAIYYASLLYLIFPIYAIIVYEKDWRLLGWIVGIAASYLYLLHGTKRWVLNGVWLCLIGIVMYLVFVFHPLNAFSFSYVGALLTFHFEEDYRSLKSVTFVCAWCALVAFVVSSRLPVEWGVFILVQFVFMMLQWLHQLYGRLKRRTEQQLSQQAHQINMLIAETERHRIGRDLHDTLGHVFATLVLKSELALKYSEKERYQEAMQEVEQVKTISRGAMQDVRQVIESLKYPTIEQELASLQELLAFTNIQCDIVVKLSTSLMAPIVQSQVVMLLREATNNVIKHAQATYYKIELTTVQDNVVLDIQDNGCGFTKGSSASVLKSLNERVSHVKGKVTIEQFANPTHIRLVVPTHIVKEYHDEIITR